MANKLKTNKYFLSLLPENISCKLLDDLEKYAEENKRDVYCLSAPLMDEKYSYDYFDGWSILIPGYPIIFVRNGGSDNDFENYMEDYIDDLSHISDKFNFADTLGRKRNWSKYYRYYRKLPTIEEILADGELKSPRDQRVMDIFLSLLLGCYNDSSQINIDKDDNILDLIKNKILLFDCNQAKFLYQDPPKHEKVVYIQGLAGTGKTELLLHKLKNLYLRCENANFGFTCYNKVLASVLRSRIPTFFNQMNAGKQIDWEGNMLCAHAWGSFGNSRSGILSHICHFYDLPWYTLGDVGSFNIACTRTLNHLNKLKQTSKNFEYCFTYMFIDESQDFPKSFIDLCAEVTEKRVYAAGDIFQNIFTIHTPELNDNVVHILLNQCYRTDPRTFMFAHAMGLGLLEQKKINWLSDEDWLKCGYHFDKIGNGSKYRFKRLPIRRFEDLGDEYASLKLYKSSNYVGGLIKEITDWSEKFPNLTPDDIAIIFLDKGDKPYEQAPKIADYIKRKFNWESNLAYVTKKKIPGTVFISNRNNVKGLEFPFVFCLTEEIKDDMLYRHTLYTMLSRSHLRSVLLIDDMNVILKESVQKGIAEIMEKGTMTVNVPNNKELADIKIAIHTAKQHLSLEQRLKQFFILEEYPSSEWKALENTLLALNLNLEEFSDIELKDKIKKAWELLH